MDRKIIEEKFNRGIRTADAAFKVMKEMDPTVCKSDAKILKMRLNTQDEAYLLRRVDNADITYKLCIHFPEDGDKVRVAVIPEEEVIEAVGELLDCFGNPELFALGED